MIQFQLSICQNQETGQVHVGVQTPKSAVTLHEAFLGTIVKHFLGFLVKRLAAIEGGQMRTWSDTSIDWQKMRLMYPNKHKEIDNLKQLFASIES